MYSYKNSFGVYEKEIGLKEEDFAFLELSDNSDKDKKDERFEEWIRQKSEHGFIDKELWSLFTTISLFVYPRLKRFREIHVSYPHGMTDNEWTEILDKMIFSFEKILQNGMPHQLDDEWVQIEEGLKLFGERFLDLWD